MLCGLLFANQVTVEPLRVVIPTDVLAISRAAVA